MQSYRNGFTTQQVFLFLIERSKKVLGVKQWSGVVILGILDSLKNTNKDILMTMLNFYGYKCPKSFRIYLTLQITDKQQK